MIERFEWFYSILSLSVHVCTCVCVCVYVSCAHVLDRKGWKRHGCKHEKKGRMGGTVPDVSFLTLCFLSIPSCALTDRFPLRTVKFCADLDECEIYPRQRNRIQSTNMGALGPFTCKNEIRRYSSINGRAIHFMRNIDKQNLEK